MWVRSLKGFVELLGSTRADYVGTAVGQGTILYAIEQLYCGGRNGHNLRRDQRARVTR